MSDRTFHSPAGPGGVGVQGGPGSALQVLTSCQSSLLRSPPTPTHIAASLCLFVLAVSLTLYLIIHRREAESLGPRSLITAALVSAGGGGGISARKGREPPEG